MAEKAWQVNRVFYCDRVQQVVTIETEVIYPADVLPDEPRVIARRCTNSKECNLYEKPACMWSGTNPNFEPT
jgi:hypothetical protein